VWGWKEQFLSLQPSTLLTKKTCLGRCFRANAWNDETNI